MFVLTSYASSEETVYSSLEGGIATEAWCLSFGSHGRFEPAC